MNLIGQTTDVILATDKTLEPPPKISKMSGKLEGIAAINTNTVTNEYYITQYQREDASNICTHCYSHNMLNTLRKNCQPAFQHNSDVLSRGMVRVPKIPAKAEYVRLNGHGELINDTHMLNICRIASQYPTKTFALWSKRYDIVKRNLSEVPDNLILVYSNPKVDNVMTDPPKGFDRVFNNVTDAYEGEANCTGQKCKECLLCYKKLTTKTIIEHVK